MHYPVWYLPTIGGGTLIACIAVIHVFISHFAVGGGLYLVMAERKGVAEQSRPILDFTRRHARFFLLTTMVFGSITGVGIWFIISLVNPRATSFLIHNFVWGWAAEWVFFTVEIAAAFVYYYLFDRMERSAHLKVGYLYFFAAWMSLALINGIIGAMLTPGSWAQTGLFWQGFFNPSFLPSLLFRTSLAILLAGCYGCLSAAWSKDEEVRVRMTRFSGCWSIAALIAAVPAAIWYGSVLPEGAKQLLAGKSPTIQLALNWGLVGVVVLLVVTLVAAIIWPRLNHRPVALIAMLAALVVLGSFEWVREAARRPFVVNGVIYSNAIGKKDVEPLTSKGYLPNALWVQHHRITAENGLAAGRELYIHQCYSCHTLGGGNNDLAARTANMGYPALVSYLGKMHTIRPFMPPFAGTTEEARALAAFLVGEVHGKEVGDIVVVGEPDGHPAPSVFPEGETVFAGHCSVCHGVEDIRQAVSGWSTDEIYTNLGRLDELVSEMPPFSGSEPERRALVVFLQAAEPDQLARPQPEDGK